MNLQQMSDKELLELIAKQDDSAFNELYNKYWRLIYRWTGNRIYDREAVKDLVQNFWADIWTNPAAIKTDQHGSAKAILLSFITYRILDFLKKKNLLVLGEDGKLSESKASAFTYTHVFEDIEIREVHRVIDELVARMPLLAREAYILRERENYSIEEISQKLSLTEETVRRKLALTNKSLRSQLLKYYLGEVHLVVLIACSGVFM